MAITVELLRDMLIAPTSAKRPHGLEVGTWHFGRSLFGKSWENESEYLGSFQSNLLEVVQRVDAQLFNWNLKETAAYESGLRANKLLHEGRRWKNIWPDCLLTVSRDDPNSLDRILNVSFSLPRDKIDYFVKEILYPAVTNTT